MFHPLVSCISFDSYIKPQPDSEFSRFRVVVYLLIPTSNHNVISKALCCTRLYIFWFLHQTTTTMPLTWARDMLYIFWFLHQTTTVRTMASQMHCCISFDSYIKPQLGSGSPLLRPVVYLLIPTSNHNLLRDSKIIYKLYIFWFLHQTTTQSWYYIPAARCISFDSYIKPQPYFCRFWWWSVVYLLIPTSNHNFCYFWVYISRLYIFWFLHQTTTVI